MPENAVRIDDSHIAEAFAARHTSDTPERVLRRLATGLLRVLKAGGTDPVTSFMMTVLGVDERAQCAQRTVDWYLFGRRDNPPFVDKPAMRGGARQALTGPLGRAPTDVEVDVIVTVLPGALNDLLTASIPVQRLVALQALTSAYVMGAD